MRSSASSPDRATAPFRVDVVGLGPAGPELITTEARAMLEGAPSAWLRTTRHPAADAFPGTPSFDHHYETGATFDDVYRAIVADVVAEARRAGSVVYAVPGSPVVAERTVVLLRQDPAVTSGEVVVVVHPALSFLELAWARLGIDPVAVGVRVVDGESFAADAAGERGPLLVAQCWAASVLSDIKLAVEAPPGATATVLHHLGLADEWIGEVGWDDLDRSFEPDHLTSLWIPTVAAPVARELVQLDELVRTLRLRCPWDREQTHGSLARHLMEESYEVLEAIDTVAAVDAAPAGDDVGVGATAASASTAGPAVDPGVEERAVAHLEEELGDLLFQVYFHATLAAEAGRFSLADVARGVHDKLVGRHPHVFGDVTATTPDQVAANWETLKKAEKNRTSVTEGIPTAMPALALAAKLQRKGLAVGMELLGSAEEIAQLGAGVAALAELSERAELSELAQRADGTATSSAREQKAIGDLLFSLVGMARVLGVDPETALRARAAMFRSAVEAAECPGPEGPGW